MIDSIKEDRDKIKPQQQQYLSYQRFDVNTAISNNSGHNCVTWCMEKLEIAGVNFTNGLKFAIKAPPKKVIQLGGVAPGK